MFGRTILLACAAAAALCAGESAPTASQARDLEARGDWAGAESAWRALLRSSPNDFRLWTDLGISLARQNRYADAVSAYRKALDLNPGAGPARLDLGLAYFKQGDFPNAARALRAAAAALPGNAQAEQLLALSLYGARNYAEAVPHLEKVAALDPSNSELLAALARSYLYNRQYDKAKAEFQTMLARDPDSPGVHMLLAQADDAVNRTSDAIAELRAALARGFVPNAHFGIGYIYWRDHRYAEAAAEFRQELESAPGNAQALAYLGDIELKDQNPEARPHLLRAASLDDSIRIAQLDLGILDTGAGRLDDATRYLKRAIALDPTAADAHYRLARIYQQTGKPAAARAELAAVTRLHQQRHEDLIEKISGPSAQNAR